MRTATNPANTAPVLLYVLWYRPRRGAKWQKVARTSTRAEAVHLIRGAGEFWIAEIRESNLAGSLFAEEVERER